MKKILLSIILLLPCFIYAQSDNPLTDNIYEDIKGVSSVININNHTAVMQINTSNDSFDLVAFNDNMQEIWHTTIPGYGVKIGKFKNKILAVATTEHQTMYGNGNTYKAILIDPETGNNLAEKIIYEDNDEYIELPQVLIGDNYFKFLARKTNVTRKLHIGVPVFAIFQLHAWTKEYNETQKLQVTDFNEKLEAVNTINAAISGTFITGTCNKNGDIFLSWLNGPDIEVYKYDAGQNTFSAKMDADAAIQPNDGTNLQDMIKFSSSLTRPGDLFYTLLYLNEDKNMELMLGKMDFANKSKNSVTQVFKKDDLKALDKGFVRVNKKLDDPDFCSPRYLNMKHFYVTDNNIVVTIGGDFTVSSPNGSYNKGYSLIMNGFDTDLKLKFQQVFPVTYYHDLALGMHAIQNTLYVVANNKRGNIDNIGVYGALDLNSGQWNKMDFLSRKDIKGYVDGEDILWFGNGFIAPYVKGHGMFTVKFDLALQQNGY